jgi:ABC-type transport system involved in multi-copper enzyme maturation permease subunit
MQPMTERAASSVAGQDVAPSVSRTVNPFGWLVGPVTRFELVRASRRGGLHLLRLVLLLFLLLFLWFSYQTLLEGGFKTWFNLRGELTSADRAALRLQDLTRFGESFFGAFLCVQLVAVVLLTPVWLGGAVAEEKDRRRLEFLLTSHLGDAEIILGKLVAGLGRLTLVVLAGLPVLAFMQFWGGIDPHLLLAGYAVTGITMVSVGALTVLCSVHSRKPREAMVLTYLVLVAFVVATLLCRFAMREAVLGISWPAWIADSNVFVVLYQLRKGWEDGKTPTELLPGLLLHFGVFHGVTTLLCVTAAVLGLRRAAWPAGRKRSFRWWRRLRWPRPSPAWKPMLWKEIFAESGVRLGRIGWGCLAVILLASVVPVVWPYIRSYKLGYSLDYRLTLRAETFEAFDIWCRLIVTGGAWLALLSVAIHAAGSVSRERERHTFESLLTTPLAARDILLAKWLGSILSVRRIARALAALWVICTGVGGTRGLTLLAFAATWTIYAGCFAMLGLWFSVTRGSTRQATTWTLVAGVVLGLAHWLPWTVARPPEHLQMPHTVAFFGLTPPAALHWLALHGDDLGPQPHSSSRLFRRFTTEEFSLRRLMTRTPAWLISPNETDDVITGTTAGLLFWLGLTAALWLLTMRRFQGMWALRVIEPPGAPPAASHHGMSASG